MLFILVIKGKRIPICCLANKKDLKDALTDVEVSYYYSLNFNFIVQSTIDCRENGISRNC